MVVVTWSLPCRPDGTRNTVTGDNEIEPNGVVPVPDCSAGSLQMVSDRIERSTRFQHYILRADELDALWRHIETALITAQVEGRSGADVEQLQRLRESVLEAHDLVVGG